MLNRVVRRTAKVYELEADLRHAELIIEQLGLQDAKSVSTPGVDGAANGGGDDGGVAGEDGQELAPAEATMFRGIAARYNDLQPDRPDIRYAVKECCRIICQSWCKFRDRIKRKKR